MIKKYIQLLAKYFALGCFGGLTYCLLEIVYRGYTHPSMLICGAVCFIALGLINEILSWDTPLWIQMILGGIIATVIEFVTGCIVNLWLGWNVWDYSGMYGNILGQICPQFSILWCIVALFAIILDDYLRYYFFGEEKPRYKLY